MSSEKSPFKDKSCYTPRPMKSHEPRKKINTVKVTSKDYMKGRRKGRKAPRLDISRPRWRIYYMGLEYYISKKRGISEALKEFTLKFPDRRIAKIVPIMGKGYIFRD